MHADAWELFGSDVDAVYVAAPNHLHAPLTCAAADHGLAVLCEKPMATRLADAEAMTAACARAGVAYATAFDQRHHAAHRRLRAQIADGALGTVTQVRVVYQCWLPPDWSPHRGERHDNWRADPERAGGGALFDLAPHGLDLAAVLLDEPLGDVRALGQRRVHDYAVDDGALLIARSDSGVLVSIDVAYNTPDALPRRRLEVVGTDGLARAVDTMGQTAGGTLELVDARDGTSTALALEDDRSPFTVQLEAFRDLVGGDLTALPAPDHDLAQMRLLAEAARQLEARP